MTPFTLLDKISDGSAADLYLAQRSDKAKVLVELSRDAVTQKPATTRSFLLEAQARQSLATSALARREQMGQCDDGRWFVMSEALDGDSVRKVLSTQGPWSARDVARMLMTLCEGLEYLHRRGLCHGKLDPSLVYLTKVNGRPSLKLVDTGLILMRAPGLQPAPKVKLVRPEYLAPERVKGQRATPSSDIYGLGILGFEMLCGRPPFQGTTDEETRAAHLEQTVPPFPVEAGPLAAILQRCLSKECEDRWPTAEVLRDALQEFLGAESDATPVVVTPIPEAARSEKTDNPPRQLMGNYELLRKIGEGAMGTVFFARHTQICREVALKVLKPEMAKDRSLVQRFFTEANAASRIRHEHIVEVFDLIEEPKEVGGRVYLVMELLHGATVRELSTRAPFPIARTVHVVRQVAKGLAAAHAQGIIHRDVKPDNIFIVRKGSDHSYVKLLDFGVAKLLGSDGEANRTVVGTAMGTPNYMAPEQTRGETVDARSDVYALGVVLFHLLSGKVPHAASSIPGLLLAISTKPPNLLPKLTPGGEVIPDGLRDIVMKCLRKEPSKRPQSMDELFALLQPFAPEPTNVALGTVANASRTGAAVKTGRANRGRVWALAASVAVMAGVGLASYTFWPRQNPLPTVPVSQPLKVAPVELPKATPPEAEKYLEIESTPPKVMAPVPAAAPAVEESPVIPAVEVPPSTKAPVKAAPVKRAAPPPPKSTLLKALSTASSTPEQTIQAQKETTEAKAPSLENELEPEVIEEDEEDIP